MFPHAFPFRSANHPLEAEEGHLSENWDPVEITPPGKAIANPKSTNVDLESFPTGLCGDDC